MNSYLVFGIIICLVLIYYVFVKRRNKALGDLFTTTKSNEQNILKDTKRKLDDQFNLERKIKQDEIDRILDKINSKGLSSLSKAEKDTLDNHNY